MITKHTIHRFIPMRYTVCLLGRWDVSAVAEKRDAARVLASKSESEPSVVSVACLGNSIIFGTDASPRKRFSYSTQLTTLLGSGYDVHNFGRGGVTLLLHEDEPHCKQPQHQVRNAILKRSSPALVSQSALPSLQSNELKTPESAIAKGLLW